MTSGEIQIANSDEIKHTLERYGERVYTYYGEADEGAENIAARWELFKTLHSIGIERLYSAMREQYAPLENYNMTERGSNSELYTDTTERTGTVTAENSRENTSEDSRTETTTNTGTVSDSGERTNTGTVSNSVNSTSTNSVAAYDSSELVNRDSTTGNVTDTRTDNTTETTTNTRTDNTTAQTTRGGMIQDTESGTTTTTNDLTDTHEHNGESEHSLTRSGNIGVTTSQQMLESEIALRVKNNVLYYAVELFVSQNCTW